MVELSGWERVAAIELTGRWSERVDGRESSSRDDSDAAIDPGRVGENPHPLKTEGAAPRNAYEARLEFAQGYGYGPCGRPDCRRQAADDAHDKGEDDAAQQQARGDFESERHVAECLPIHRGGRQAVQREHCNTADRSAYE